MTTRALVATCLLLSACSRTPEELWIEPQNPVKMDKRGQSVQLKAQTRDGRHVFLEYVTPTWSSADEAVATVSAGGLVEAAGTGTTTITAALDNLKASVPVKVRIVGSVEISPSGPQKIKIYKSMQFTATVKDDRGRVLADEPVRWTRTTVEVDVDQKGKVSAEATGPTELIAKAKDKEARVKIEVTPP